MEHWPLHHLGRLSTGVGQTPADAAIGQRRIHRCQFFHRHFGAAQGQCQAVVLLALQPRHAGQLHELVQAGLAQPRGKGHSRHIAAADQRLLRGDRPGETAVEVFRRKRPERGRRILQHSARMQQALVQRQGIDEGLQGRAGRALGQRAVDLAGDSFVAMVGRADDGAHLHRGRIEQQGTGVVQADICTAGEVLRHHALQRALHRQVECGTDFALAFVLGQQHVGGVRREHRQVGTALRIEGKRHLGRMARNLRIARRPHGPKPFSRLLQLWVAPACGDALARILRNHCQGQRLGQIERARRLAEIDQAGRAYAFDIAAVGCGVEIRLQQVALAVAQLQPKRGGRLRQLAAEAAAVDGVEAPRQLHGERRTPLAARAGGGAPGAAH